MAKYDEKKSCPGCFLESPGDADHCNTCGYDFRLDRKRRTGLGRKRRTGRTSPILLVAGTFLWVVGGFFFWGGALAGPEDRAELVFFLVIGSVLVGIGGLVVGMAFRVDRLTIARRKSRTLKYKTYDEVPWYRREPGGLAFLAAIVFAPVTIALCIVCLTGEVYRNSYDGEGNLEVWGVGNKVAAVLILAFQIGITMLFMAVRR